MGPSWGPQRAPWEEKTVAPDRGENEGKIVSQAGLSGLSLQLEEA